MLLQQHLHLCEHEPIWSRELERYFAVKITEWLWFQNLAITEFAVTLGKAFQNDFLQGKYKQEAHLREEILHLFSRTLHPDGFLF